MRAAAASTLLMIQTALPCLLLLPSSLGSSSSSAEAGREAGAAAAAAPPITTTLELVGGTDASAAPPADYARLVLLPTLRRAFARPAPPPPPPPPSSTAAAPPSAPLFEVDLRVRRRGFFPKGQGVVSLTVKSLRPGEALPPIVLERRRRNGSAERVSVEVSAFSAGDAVPEVAARAAAEACVAALLESRGAVNLSRERISVAVSRLQSPEEAFGDGGGVIAVAKVEGEGGAAKGGEGEGEGEGGDVLLLGSAQPLSPPPKGSSNKKQKTAATAAGPSFSSYSPAPSSPAQVGAQVGSDLARDLSAGGGAAATDRWLQDQLIIFMALARGHSRIETCALTEHTRSAIAVAEALTAARFRVVEIGGEGGACLIECDGAGVEAH